MRLTRNNVLKLLLSDLETLTNAENAYEVYDKLRTDKAKQYVKGLKYSKPESLLADKLFKPLIDVLKLFSLPEPVAGKGWVDFLIREGINPPVAIELKALHDKNGKKISLDKKYGELKSLFDKNKTNQIITYLKDFDYVILTNLDDVYYLNREAVYDFKPFRKEKFKEFIKDLREIGDIWELARRKEDETPKKDLDEIFFEDLKRWYSKLANLKWKKNENEAIVLLLNKLIFIRTLEDFALIPFRFLQTTYLEKKDRWNAKGSKTVLEKFFEEIDNWFYTYYDTELFGSESNILNYLDDDSENLKNFMSVLEDILGVNVIVKAFERSLNIYNFRYIDEDVFGKSYETFLAERRKDQGIYYTPKEITRYMSEKLVKELFQPVKEEILKAIDNSDYDKAEDACRKLINISILDPACGSGSFLIKVVRGIYDIYLELDRKTEWATRFVSFDLPADMEEKLERGKKIREILGFDNLDRKKLLSLIVLRHIYGVDLDERAVDVAKVNIWKEVVKLSPNDFRYSKLPEDKNHILPDLEMNIVCGDSIVSLPEEITVKEIAENFREDIRKMWDIRKKYLQNPFNPNVLKEIKPIKEKIRNHLIEVFKRWEDEKGVNYIGNPLFYPLEFFHLYFDENGEPLPKEKWGFDGVIGNPPWENIKPYSKEFAAYHPEIFGEISKFSIDGPTFKKLFAKKMKDPRVKALWDEYERKIKSLSEFIRSRFRLYGKGDLSYQKVFLERAMELSKNAVVLLVPSNFHTDEGAMLLRKEVFENYCLKELISFENRAHGWFKDIDPRFKFDIVFFTKEKCDKPFKAAFYVTRSDYEEWGAENGGSFSDFLKAVTFEYPVNLIPKISPDVLGVVEFRSEKDVAMVQKIRKDWKFLRDYGWDIKSELHMTNDNDLFNTKGRGLVLYEGKMIHQYEPFFSEPRYWVEEEKGRSRLLSKELSRIKRFLKSEGERLGLKGKKLEEFVKDNLKMAIENFEKSIFKLDYEDYRLAYRAIARSTDERTLISCILPPKVFMGHSLNYFKPYYYAIEDGILVQRKRSYEDTVYLMALLNSFVLDYYIRQRVSANLTMFFLYELPIPDVSEKLKQEVVEKAFRLLYRKDVYDDMAKELGMKVNEIKDENKRRELRAELEIIIARDVFGLTREDVEFILSTFVYGNPDRELMKMVVEMFDNFPAVV